MKIRAATILADHREFGEKLVEDLDEGLEVIREEVERAGIPLISTRIVFSEMSVEELGKHSRLLDKLCQTPDFIAAPLVGRDVKPYVLEYLNTYPCLFISINGGWDAFLGYLDTVKAVSQNLGPREATRLSFTINGPIATPYFPSTSAPKGSLSLAFALRYADDVERYTDLGVIHEKHLLMELQRMGELLSGLAAKVGLEPFGIDFSLSPWMEESVARIVEKFGGIRFGEPGTPAAISQINHYLKMFAEMFGGVGYNEVMLPYAEDNLLMDLGRRGLLSAHKLALLSPSCVAGYDMVPIPLEWVDTVVKDAYALLSSKRQPSGIRVIPVDAAQGEEVDLGRFGRIVIPPPV